jgi:hypothetical protein
VKNDFQRKKDERTKSSKKPRKIIHLQKEKKFGKMVKLVEKIIIYKNIFKCNSNLPHLGF